VARFDAELGSITPKLGADAAIFNEKGQILLMERTDGSGWCLPCGWVDANERPVDAAVREVRIDHHNKRDVSIRVTRLADPHCSLSIT